LDLLKEKSDVGGQLNWLNIRLGQALADSLHVFIIGHIPPGSPQCNSHWSKRYQAIIEKYQNIIRLQAFGNPVDGTDGYRLQYPAKGDKNPFGVIHIAGSMGTYGFNPNARLYIMDSMQNLPLYVQKLTWELSYWNSNPGVDWIFNMKTILMSDQGPQGILSFANGIKTNSFSADNYYQHMTRNFDAPSGTCGIECRDDIYCGIVSQTLEEEIDCRGKTLDL
jgi:sphingomyelin phosphodiesterase